MLHWNDLPLRIKGLAVIAIPLIALLVSTAWLMVTVRQERRAQSWVAHTLEAKTQIAATLSLLVDAETGVRGLLLTHNEEAARPYEASMARWPSTFARLVALVSDNPSQIERTRKIDTLVTERPLAAVADFARSQSNAPAPVDLLAKSRTVMAALRAELVDMNSEEDRLLRDRVATADRAQDRLVFVTLAGASLGALGGVLAATAFAAGITGRLGLVREHADRLARGEAMTAAMVATLSGADEVGHLARRLDEAGALMARHIADTEAARQELDRFFSLSLDLLCIADLEGRFVRVNPAWHEMLGWSTEDLTLVPYNDFVHPDDVALTTAEAARLADGRTTVNFENRYRASDGSYRWLNWKATAVSERGLIYATARDVTEQKWTATALQDRVSELGMANRELEAFSYSVSHDLRAPLRHITGFASLLQKHAGQSLDETGDRYLKTIADSATRMGRLIDDLLTFSRMGRAAMTKRNVDLGTIVLEAQRDSGLPADGRDISIHIGALPVVSGDDAMLRLVLTNLLSNAVKYTATRKRAQIEIGSRMGDDGQVVIFVKDNGVGFDSQYAHKLFGVFQRLHSSDEFDGTGIGLANVRRIVHRHGGRTWAEGVVDRGATFYFSLPAATGVIDEVPA